MLFTRFYFFVFLPSSTTPLPSWTLETTRRPMELATIVTVHARGGVPGSDADEDTGQDSEKLPTTMRFRCLEETLLAKSPYPNKALSKARNTKRT